MIKNKLQRVTKQDGRTICVYKVYKGTMVTERVQPIQTKPAFNETFFRAQSVVGEFKVEFEGDVGSTPETIQRNQQRLINEKTQAHATRLKETVLSGQDVAETYDPIIDLKETDITKVTP